MSSDQPLPSVAPKNAIGLIPRLAESLDAELIRQKIASQWVIDLDPESLAVAVLIEAANQLEAAGWKSPALWFREEAKK